MWAKIIDNSTATPTVYEFKEPDVRNVEYRLLRGGEFTFIIEATHGALATSLEQVTSNLNLSTDINVELYHGTTLLKSVSAKVIGYVLDSTADNTVVEKMELAKK